jgi:hypothetical protein
VKQWLDEVANQRLHRETRERPDQRFLAGSLLPVPALLPDYRDTADALVHKDLRSSMATATACRLAMSVAG